MTKGLFIGKFLPFHRGHMSSILQASTQCDHLYVVVSQHRNSMLDHCKKHNIKPMPLELVTMWLNKEFQDFSHITVVPVDETGFPKWPQGWPEFSEALKRELHNIKVDIKDINFVFGSKKGYSEEYQKYINPTVEYISLDLNKKYVDISSSELVKNIYTNWEMLPSSVRLHFVKKVLIVGTESCGKTTVVRKLAKHYLTSWSEEYGKWYQDDFMGGYEGNWTVDDFERIAFEQLKQDEEAYRTANKVAFIDTDAIITEYYLDMFLNEQSDLIHKLSEKEMNKWDLVFMLKPTVPWVDDNTRRMGKQEERERLHEELKARYDELGIKYIELGGDYHYRYNYIINEVDKMLYGLTK